MPLAGGGGEALVYHTDAAVNVTLRPGFIKKGEEEEVETNINIASAPFGKRRGDAFAVSHRVAGGNATAKRRDDGYERQPATSSSLRRDSYALELVDVSVFDALSFAAALGFRPFCSFSFCLASAAASCFRRRSS